MTRPDEDARRYEGYDAYDAYDDFGGDWPPGWWILGCAIYGAAFWTVIGVVLYRVLT